MDFLEHIRDRSFGLLGSQQDESIAWVDYLEEVVTFPLWNLSGQLIGYQQYNWDKPKNRQNNSKGQKYFTYLPKGSIGVYGLDLLPQGYSGPICLVEGIWEAIIGHCFGIPCLAVLGVSSRGTDKQTMNWLNSLPNEIIPLCQDDKAGVALSKCNLSKAIFLKGDLDDLLLEGGGWMAIPQELITLLD